MTKRWVMVVVTSALWACSPAMQPDGGTGGGTATGGGSATGGGTATGGGNATGGGGGQVDTTAPEVTGTTPLADAMDVPPGTNVSVRFSEPMNTSSVTVTAAPSFDLGNLSWNATNTELSLTPPQAFAGGTGYTLTVAGTDVAGNALAGFTFTFTTASTADTTPPAVIASQPAAGATGIADTAPIIVQFNEPMRTDSVTVTTTPSVMLDPPTFTNGDRDVTFLPTNAWQPNTQYAVSVTGRDASGNQLAAPHTFSFTTGAAADTTPPTLTGSVPVANAMMVATNTRLSLTFSEPMDVSSVAASTTPAIALGTPAFSNGDRTVTFDMPAANFAPSTTYAVSVNGADLRGNMLATASFSFTTAAAADTTPPIVAGTTPNAAAVGVPTNARLAIAFSEGMDTAATEAAISISAGGNAVPCVVTWQASDSLLTCTPGSPLAASTLHTVTVRGGATTAATDKVGNKMAMDYTFSFTTGTMADTAAPTVASTTPSTTAGAATPGTIGVALTTTAIVVTFSEAMDKATTQAAFQLSSPSGAQGGAFTWNAAGTELTYTLPTSYVPPPGTVFSFGVAGTATDVAGNALAMASTGSRFFRLRRQDTLSLYACGANATCTTPAAQAGNILAGASCAGATAGVNQDLYVGDELTFNYTYRSFETFDMTPLTNATSYPALAIQRAVLTVTQLSCVGTPYAVISRPTSLSRQMEAAAVDYGTTLTTADCALNGSGAHQFTLPTSLAAGVVKTSDVTATFTGMWSNRAARGNRAQYTLRLNQGTDGDGQTDRCQFASHTSTNTRARPFVAVTFTYD